PTRRSSDLRAPIDPATARMMTARRPRSVELTPVGLPALRKLIERFIAVGFSKFVVRPVVAPASWHAELDALSAAVGDLQICAVQPCRPRAGMSSRPAAA